MNVHPDTIIAGIDTVWIGHCGTYSDTEKAGTRLNCDIIGLSERSARRMSAYLRDCAAIYRNFGTLTYPADLKVTPLDAKRHLKNLLQYIRNGAALLNIGKEGPVGYIQTSPTDLPDPTTYGDFSLFWFLEFQANGQPHFHFFCTHRIDKDWLARQWYAIVGTGNINHLKAGTQIDRFKAGRKGARSYARKYAAKESQKDTHGASWGRMWGVCGLRAVIRRRISLTGKTEEHGLKIDMLGVKLVDKLERLCETGEIGVLRGEFGNYYYGIAASNMHHVHLLMDLCEIEQAADRLQCALMIRSRHRNCEFMVNRAVNDDPALDEYDFNMEIKEWETIVKYELLTDTSPYTESELAKY
jgi:hypothetical protein